MILWKGVRFRIVYATGEASQTKIVGFPIALIYVAIAAITTFTVMDRRGVVMSVTVAISEYY